MVRNRSKATMPSWMRWLLAIRPKTLGISFAPVLVACALAYRESGLWSGLTLLVTLLATLAIQIGTNLYNDAADFERGADTPDRLGPPRASAEGWFSVGEVKRAAALSFTTAFCAGIYLAWVGGWPIIAIGLGSLIAGYAYTGGPRPIAYSGSGELFVFIFFGLVAVTGSYYLQTRSVSLNAWLVASALGLLASAVLLVNNYRDLETDRAAEKLTLVHYLGQTGAQHLYSALLLLPFLLPAAMQGSHSGSWLVVALLPAALYLRRRLIDGQPGEPLNRLLAATAQLQLGFALLLSLGLTLFT